MKNEYDFKNKFIFRKNPNIIPSENLNTKNIKDFKELQGAMRKSLYFSGKLLASGYFIFCLFSLQSYFLRQNIEYKQRTFISD